MAWICRLCSRRLSDSQQLWIFSIKIFFIVTDEWKSEKNENSNLWWAWESRIKTMTNGSETPKKKQVLGNVEMMILENLFIKLKYAWKVSRKFSSSLLTYISLIKMHVCFSVTQSRTFFITMLSMQWNHVANWNFYSKFQMIDSSCQRMMENWKSFKTSETRERKLILIQEK